MIRSHQLANQHQRRQLALASNPVARAFERAGVRSRAQQAEAEFKDQLLTVRITMLSAQDGEEATELLAKLAVVIGTPCEAGARQYGHQEPWVRQLHGALRTIQAMCLQGYRWQAQYALALDRAVEIAGDGREFEDPHFTASWVEANGLAGRILNHDVDAEAIAA